MHRLAIVTLRTVEVDPPVYETASRAAYARCIRFLPPLIWATLVNFGYIDFGKFYSDFLLLFRNQTLVNCTSLDSLMCVVYFYNKLKVICATSKHLERNKCWQVGSRYGNLNRPVATAYWNQCQTYCIACISQAAKVIISHQNQLPSQLSTIFMPPRNIVSSPRQNILSRSEPYKLMAFYWSCLSPKHKLNLINDESTTPIDTKH